MKGITFGTRHIIMIIMSLVLLGIAFPIMGETYGKMVAALTGCGWIERALTNIFQVSLC